MRQGKCNFNAVPLVCVFSEPLPTEVPQGIWLQQVVDLNAQTGSRSFQPSAVTRRTEVSGTGFEVYDKPHQRERILVIDPST
jgi:hypothetical protein